MKRILTTAVLLSVCAWAWAGIDHFVKEIAERDYMASGIMGVKAQTISGEVLADYNSRVRLVPASNVKLISTAMVLDKLGADYRFPTTLACTGRVDGGVLCGDLYIVGSGDPSTGLNGPVVTLFSYWKGILDKNGITSIDGRIIADHRCLGTLPVNKGWLIEDVDCGDGLPQRGLNFRHNVRNPENIFNLNFKADPSPLDSCAAAFRNFLVENGTAVRGGTACDTASFVVPSDSLRTLGASYSDRLADMVRHTNYQSDNFYAEAFMHKVCGKRKISDAIKSFGVDPSNCQIIDGCGLSRKDYVTAEFFCDFLIKAQTKSSFNSFLRSLPQPGKGTLSSRLAEAPKSVKDRIYMKSGSMNGVRCFSGYILPSGEDKEMIVFSVLTNNLPGNSKQVFCAIDEIIENLAAEN